MKRTVSKSDGVLIILLVLLVLVLVILFTSGCTMRESFVPTGPSTIVQPTSVSVVVRAFLQQPHEPIEGAIISVDGHIRGTTDLFGELQVSVIAGRDVTICAQKDGYTALLTSATATITADGEIWTFYFEASGH